MAVFRIEKTRDYTVMANHHLRNTKLSLKAKGLLSLMLSLPEDWDYTTKGLAKICKDGVDSICSTVNELEEHGYVIRERIRNAKGQLTDIQYTILEQPKPSQPGQGKPKQEKDVRKYLELKEYRKGGNRQNNKLPVWVAFSYFELGTVTMMYNYLRGDFRKAILAYSFAKTDYAKRDTEVTDTWLDAVRNLRNYCAHNSMLVGMTSSVVLLDSNDDTTLLQADNDLFSRIYALKKLVPTADVDNMKNDIKKLIKETPVDVYLLGILPSNWEEIYDKIVEF